MGIWSRRRLGVGLQPENVSSVHGPGISVEDFQPSNYPWCSKTRGTAPGDFHILCWTLGSLFVLPSEISILHKAHTIWIHPQRHLKKGIESIASSGNVRIRFNCQEELEGRERIGARSELGLATDRLVSYTAQRPPLLRFLSCPQTFLRLDTLCSWQKPRVRVWACESDGRTEAQSCLEPVRYSANICCCRIWPSI